MLYRRIGTSDYLLDAICMPGAHIVAMAVVSPFFLFLFMC
jgi:hypothetical protein